MKVPQEKRLHLGCGKNYLPPSDGWTNHDVVSTVRADVYADMTALPFVPESFDLLYASHVLEHCHRHEVLATLSHWRNLLKSGGTLRLAVPDFEAVVIHYMQHRDIPAITGLLYGGQTTRNNMHHIAFDTGYLVEMLTKAGFIDAKPWDWRKTDHAQFDDYSQAYLSGTKETGLHVSLNIEARKP